MLYILAQTRLRGENLTNCFTCRNQDVVMQLLLYSKWFDFFLFYLEIRMRRCSDIIKRLPLVVSESVEHVCHCQISNIY